MSSSRTAAAKAAPRAKTPVPRKPAAARPATVKAVKPTAKPVAVAASNGGGNGVSNVQANALRLAGEVEQALKDGRLDILPPDALQALLASLCKLYSANVEQGAPYLPVGPRSGVTPTDVMVVASKLLRATNLQVFELGMWQSWTGR